MKAQALAVLAIRRRPSDRAASSSNKPRPTCQQTRQDAHQSRQGGRFLGCGFHKPVSAIRHDTLESLTKWKKFPSDSL